MTRASKPIGDEPIQRQEVRLSSFERHPTVLANKQGPHLLCLIICLQVPREPERVPLAKAARDHARSLETQSIVTGNGKRRRKRKEVSGRDGYRTYSWTYHICQVAIYVDYMLLIVSHGGALLLLTWTQTTVS